MADDQARRNALSRLLDEAPEAPPQAPGTWLESLPVPQAHLGDTLMRLIGEHAASPGPETRGPDETEAHGGDAVGAYRLIRQVASGGMGSVWLAERVDGALRRQVALKLPHLAWGAGLAERMARERDIGARLEHPHIARLYDAGLDHRGRPFLAFEYIDGVSIDAWCQAHELSIRARLRLFLQVAQAVAYAHTRLVVHRDLKPSNVMVTADAQVHLLDFGVAKLLQESRPDDTGLTQRLGQAMTPHYASPEQLRGEPVTVASDVYSLGVMLYELLTGRRPHEPRRASIAALEEAILQAEPMPASRRVGDNARARALRGDVDAILAKALRRELERRYATVDAMADDVQRHLAGEPVRARPATAFYRWGKWVVRSRAGLALGSVAATSVAVAAVLSLAQAEQANEAAVRARAAIWPRATPRGAWMCWQAATRSLTKRPQRRWRCRRCCSSSAGPRKGRPRLRRPSRGRRATAGSRSSPGCNSLRRWRHRPSRRRSAKNSTASMRRFREPCRPHRSSARWRSTDARPWLP